MLIAPLDWGLGHATRCIPLISYLKDQQIRVLVSGEGSIKSLLQQEFPDIEMLPLKGYNIKYSRDGKRFLVNMLFQIPKMIYSVWHENRWLKKTIKKYDIDAVISDNRLGCFNNSVHTVFITHQLNIKTGNSFTDKIIRRINYFFINQYDECWIPDYPFENNLAGELSHPNIIPCKPMRYIGVLSRFQPDKTVVKKNKLCIILSGPEPQRTILENKIIQGLDCFAESVIIVRGIPDKIPTLKNLHSNIIQYNHQNAAALSNIIQESEIIIARSGYSTMMDLMTLQQKAILIPTPGQTEQEYLAAYLNDKALCYAVSQDEFNLSESLKKIDGVDIKDNIFEEIYKEALDDWLNRIHTLSN